MFYEFIPFFILDFAVQMQKKMSGRDFIDPGATSKGKEIVWFLRNEFKNVPVLLHLDRDVQTYEKEKKSRQKILKEGTQRVMKQVTRPGRIPNNDRHD